MVPSGDPQAAFLDASVWHGDLDRANAILAAHPEIAASSIYTAAVLGDDTAVRRFLAQDPFAATARGGPRDWDPLTWLCFSKYLRLDRARSDAFFRTAQALLDAGSSPDTGFFDHHHRPDPEYESVLYGAAGVAHHAPLTRLLIERGADPNDEEVPYHSPEGYDNAALEVLVNSGKLTAHSLTTMLLRKHDWHDYEGIRWLLDHGGDPNRMTRWRRTPFQQALLRDNALRIIEALLDRGGDPPVALAAQRGRGDVLDLFERRGIPFTLQGADHLLAACARHRQDEVRDIAAREPHLLTGLRAEAGQLLANFAGNGNTGGVRLLLDLGLDPRAVWPEGDVYWDIAVNSTPLHVAAWRASHANVKLLLQRGAAVDALDGKGRTPLVLAVRACVDSYWTARRSPESVAALLQAGASPAAVALPCGYDEVDALLRTPSETSD